mmetsp:Transcript_7665/g.15212  ORF Transcript_7665/g.15212 Transcript_7665/m.15212 type:complete len:141 (-) Transcript_7665:367-789(-)
MLSMHMRSCVRRSNCTAAIRARGLMGKSSIARNGGAAFASTLSPVSHFALASQYAAMPDMASKTFSRNLQQAAVPDPVAVQDKFSSPSTADIEFKTEEPFVVLDRRGEFYYEPFPCVESRHPTSADGRANGDEIEDLLYL